MKNIASLIVAFGLLSVPALAATCTVTSTADDGSAGTLRACVAGASDGDTVNFSLPSPSTIQLGSSIQISQNLTIQGPGPANLTVAATSSDVFDIGEIAGQTEAITVPISGVTIENGFTGVSSTNPTDGSTGTTAISLQNVILLNNDNGVLVMDGATATISQSTISQTAPLGPGVAVESDGINFPNSVATISQSTISGNLIGLEGMNCDVTVFNSTLYGNGYTVSSTRPRADVLGSVGSSWVISYSTIDAPSTIVTPAIIAYDPSAVFLLKSTIVADHSGGDCTFPNGQAVITDGGYNLDSDASCGLTAGTDLFGSSSSPLGAGLADALAANGGATQTDALQTGSPALGWIPASACTDTNAAAVTVDQRNLPRPTGGACDVGAFEHQNTTTPLTVSLQVSGPSNAANFQLVASFTTSATIDPVANPVTLQIGNYSATIAPGAFKQLQGGSKTGSWVYSGVSNGASLQIQLVNSGNGNYQFKAMGGPADVGTQAPIPVKITISSFVGAGTNAPSVKGHK